MSCSTQKENKKKIYSIQKHDATTLHYDLRLEKDDVLKSWAIPKKPSKNPSDKRLAIQTPDHPIDYAFFEGVIEEGKYGSGEVEIWDKGTYKIIKWKQNEIIIDIDGDNLKGKYVLIRFKPEEQPKNWLFFKKKEG
ncbi:MAG: DNA polymerase ligase N-terminal domain-containing protein [Candidatus Thermoplasmatota archaeon]